jgi:hypothetical protein
MADEYWTGKNVEVVVTYSRYYSGILFDSEDGGSIFLRNVAC